MLSTLTVLAISYVLGSVPSAIWVGKIFKGIDVREHGSGNAGTTNTFRVLGVPFGITVFVLDFMKGFIPSFYLSVMAFDLFAGPLAPPNWDVEAFLKITAGLFAVIGHMFPIFARFKGGKGAATACGMLFGVEPISIAISFSLFGIIVLTTKYVSLASILSSLSYPIVLFVMRFGLGMDIDGSIIVFSVIIASGIIIKHKANIRRLMEGTENRVGKKKQETESSQELETEKVPL
jgi:glycerol-3-phosphate acyltransferase PlsY